MVLLGSTVLLSFAGTWPECRWQPRLHRWHGPSRRAACGAGAGPRAPAPNEKRCLKEPCTALKGVLKIDNSTYCMGSILITAHVEIFFFFSSGFFQWKKKKSKRPLTRNFKGSLTISFHQSQGLPACRAHVNFHLVAPLPGPGSPAGPARTGPAAARG